jgi:hypothetical protein
MAKIKVVNKRDGKVAVGSAFRNIPSETIFSFNNFSLETNFSTRVVKNYNNTLSSFVKPITLDTLNVSYEDSLKIKNYTTNVNLNIDSSDLGSYVKYGSLKELLRVSIENIILEYPSSLYISYQTDTGTLFSVFNYSYDSIKDQSSFRVPVNGINNTFGLVINQGNEQLPQNNALRNINVSYNNYIIWRPESADTNSYQVIAFTGLSLTTPYLDVIVKGNPFPTLSGGTTQGFFNYHIKPQPLYFNKFYEDLSKLEKYMVSNKTPEGYLMTFKKPILLENGGIAYSNQDVVWTTIDGYNVDITGALYEKLLQDLGDMGDTYDKFKTDTIARFLVPQSLLLYDTTQDEKMSKLLRVYGRNFDTIKTYIDAIANISTLTYDKKNNIPDSLVKNFAKTLGWDVTTLVSDDDLLSSFFSTTAINANDYTPPEVDIELWRRILLNTNYLFKAKGTRHALKAMFLLVGIPEPFIDIKEYIYTVDAPIDPNTVTVSLADLPSASLPYNGEGYPIAPKETKKFYFQISGSSDSGQAYIDLYRSVGFNVNRTEDNKKSWVQSGTTERVHYSTPNYYQNDSKLIINTKEVDATLDISRGIEYDMFKYNIDNNFPITDTGRTKPMLYINIPFTYGVSANTFTLPEPAQGDIQVNFNGITLRNNVDYVQLDSTSVQLIGGVAQTYTTNNKDIVTLTYANDHNNTGFYNQIDFIVTSVVANPSGMVIPLPEMPLGEVQLTINGISLAKSGTLFTGDYIQNPSNAQELIVVNNSLMTYLQSNPIVVISYFKSTQAETLEKKSEVYKVDSFASSKFFFNITLTKYTYVLDYEPPDVHAIKIMINGLTLQNGTDFILNPSNKKQVLFNTSAINLGYVIHVFYVVDSAAVDVPIDFGDFDFPDLSQITFLEYLELINRRLINAKNRKTITDHEGGIYPTVQKLYEEYLKISFAKSPIVPSNGYTFYNLYPFINKFNAYFHKFIDQMLSATIILKKGGVLIRNTSYTKQKFTYRRGVSFVPKLNYLGDDGSMFSVAVPPPIATPLYIYQESENKPVNIYQDGENKPPYLYLESEITI